MGEFRCASLILLALWEKVADNASRPPETLYRRLFEVEGNDWESYWKNIPGLEC